MSELSILTSDDEAARERLNAAAAAMVVRTRSWSQHNTGSNNVDGLKAFAPKLADAFSELDASIELVQGPGFESVGNDGKVTEAHTGPVIEITSRPSAPLQVVMSGHYDTVFAPGVFETVTDLGDGRINGPGMADMKGGLCVMLEALKAFEAGPSKSKLGYRIVLTPDEEIGNFTSSEALRRAASSGALIGMTYEPAMETGAMSGGRKGSAVFDIVLHGKAAHAGRAKEEGRSAIEAAAELVVGVEGLNGQFEGVTFNVGSIDGGAPVNIVPDIAVVRFGARAPTSRRSNGLRSRCSACSRKQRCATVFTAICTAVSIARRSRAIRRSRRCSMRCMQPGALSGWISSSLTPAVSAKATTSSRQAFRTLIRSASAADGFTRRKNSSLQRAFRSARCFRR